MKTLRRSRLWLAMLPAASLLLLTSAACLRAATPTVKTFVRLGGTTAGYDPQAALVKGTDGNFYGTTEAGGPPNCGTVFKITTGGTLTTLYSFKGGADGANPKGALVLGGDGNFYGTTSAAGAGSTGTVFKITSAGALTTIHGFTARGSTNADGTFPSAALIKGSDGNFYGTAYQGGTHGAGTVFKITAAGAFTTLYSFGAKSDGSDGSFPQTALAQGSDGNFYGTAGGGTAFSGIVFKLTPAGALTNLHTFTGGADGYIPNSLIRGSDGNFYGTTQYGGTSSQGTAFRVTPAGAFTSLHKFAATVDGQSPVGTLTQGSDGNFYGTTSTKGPNNGFGTVFKMTPAGTVSVLYTFPLVTSNGTEGALDGAGSMAGVVQGGDGNFYGTAAGGGSLNGSTLGQGGGTVFKLTPGGTLTVLTAFVLGGSDSSAGLLQAADGNFYGTTARGGAGNAGTIFAADISGNTQSIHSFDLDTEGGGPGAALVQDASGNIFGTASQGGTAGEGTLFQFSTSSGTPAARGGIIATGETPGEAGKGFVTETLPVRFAMPPKDEYNFTSPFAYSPGGLIAGGFIAFFADSPRNSFAPRTDTTTATICGIAQRGGSSLGGAIYGYSASEGVKYVYDFGARTGDGLTPQGIIQGKDGNFYGTTKAGGTAGYGTVFKFVPGGTLTTLHSFTGQGNGALPEAGLIQGSDGNFYGTCAYSTANSTDGISGSGTIFQITPAGAFKTLKIFPENGSQGGQPLAALLQGKDGVLYGTTSYGGDSFEGTVFSISTGGTFTNLYSFGNFGDGQRPLGALIQATDGNLYGTTAGGGTDDSGTIFRVVLKVPSPVITSATTAPGQVGVAFAYQIAASNSPTSYGESGLPSGLTINQTTGKITGKPTKAGTYSVTIAAFNSGGSGSAKLTLTVKAAAAKPVITSSLNPPSRQGVAFSYQITATNSPTKYGESGLPAGLAINQTTGKISGTPTKAGTYNVTIAAFNSAGSGSAKTDPGRQAAGPEAAAPPGLFTEKPHPLCLRHLASHEQ